MGRGWVLGHRLVLWPRRVLRPGRVLCRGRRAGRASKPLPKQASDRGAGHRGMGRVQLFEICLRQGRVVYSPGEPLAGVVRVRLGAPLPFRGGRGVAPGEWVDAFLPAVGAGLSKTSWSVGSETGFSVSREPWVTTEPRAPGSGCAGRPGRGRQLGGPVLPHLSHPVLSA